MSEAEEEEPSESETNGNQCGVILGYWDHEKTPALIKGKEEGKWMRKNVENNVFLRLLTGELENSVTQIEEKCKKLLQELIYYKKYLEESNEFNCYLFDCKRKTNNPKSQCLCGSESDIVLRKNFINSQETRQLFEEKFHRKLSCINRELTEVAQKIGLKNNIVLFPTKDYLKTLNAQIENEVEKSWCDVRHNFIAERIFKVDADPVTGRGREVEFSKITKNELDLYLKLSRLNAKRRKRKVRNCQAACSKERKIKLGGRWKMCKLRQDLQRSAFDCGKPESETKKFKKKRNKVPVARIRKWRSPPGFRAAVRSGRILNESESEKAGRSPSEFFVESGKRKAGAEGGTNLWPVAGKMGPRHAFRTPDFDPTAKQVPHLRKRKSGVRASASENLRGKAGATITSFGGTTHLEKGRAILRSPSDTEKETSKLGGGGNLRMKEGRALSSFGKAQSMYTCSRAEDFPENRKPRAMRCTDGRRSVIKTLPKRAQAAGSKVTGSHFLRADVFKIGKSSGGFEKSSGEGSLEGGRAKLSKERNEVCSSLLSAYRGYLWLKKALTSSSLALADKDLKSAGVRIDCSLERLLQFYSKFVSLNHRPESLKISCEAKKNARRRGGNLGTAIAPSLQSNEQSFQRKL